VKKNRILFVKPPDRFLDDEFVYQQLGPHYLQSYLLSHDIESDILVLFEDVAVRKQRILNLYHMESLSDLCMMLIYQDGKVAESPFNIDIFGEYDIVAMSVMSPQAPDAYRLSESINKKYPHIITVIGGSHARYYYDSVINLPNKIAFDFVVPNDGWEPMLGIASSKYLKNKMTNSRTQVLSHEYKKVLEIPAPT
jgi:hypothetical protein